MSTPLTCLSSMATRQLLTELLAGFERRSGRQVLLTAIGGVDAARRVQAGERFDLVVLAADAIDKLVAAGALQVGSRVDLVRSPIAVAVRAGAPRPDIGSEAAVRQAVLAARSVGFSTGPSGVHLSKLFASWGVVDTPPGRVVQAPAGVPVGTLVADGQVELGFQQLSELLHVPGIEVLGLLPPDMAFITTFSAGLCPGPQAPETAALLDFLNSAEAADAKRRHGMEPA